jgi:hypothetical protein
MSKLNADLRQVTLEHLEDEPEVVNNPIPYIIDYIYIKGCKKLKI